MTDVSLVKVAAALGVGIVLALVFGLVLGRRAEASGGRGLFTVFFLVLTCAYALGFAARFVLVELLP